ncbi:MAG: PTS sugar transporter subunit IIA [candidate division WOR-3 bacterium]
MIENRTNWIEIFVKKIENEDMGEFPETILKKFFDDKILDEKKRKIFDDQIFSFSFVFDETLFLKDQDEKVENIKIFIGFSEKEINLNKNDTIKFLFIISFPSNQKTRYLELLGYLKRLLSSKNFKQKIFGAKDEFEIKEIFEKELNDLET